MGLAVAIAQERSPAQPARRWGDAAEGVSSGLTPEALAEPVALNLSASRLCHSPDRQGVTGEVLTRGGITAIRIG
jgi:hypothetical protein